MDRYNNTPLNEDKIYDYQDDLDRFTLLGKFASILFHEIGSSLCKMKMNLDVYKDAFSNNDELGKVYRTFQTEIANLNNFSNEIKQYSRPAEIIPAKINIFMLFEGIENQVSKKLNDKRITLINNASDILIISDYLKLQTAFLRLLVSKIDSMENDGILEITTKLLDNSEKLTIIISNNGDSAFNIDPIFNPYDINITSGTGLSMLIFKQIIIDLGGSIKFLSSDNDYSSIEILLPCDLNG